MIQLQSSPTHLQNPRVPKVSKLESNIEWAEAEFPKIRRPLKAKIWNICMGPNANGTVLIAFFHLLNTEFNLNPDRTA